MIRAQITVCELPECKSRIACPRIYMDGYLPGGCSENVTPPSATLRQSSRGRLGIVLDEDDDLNASLSRRDRSRALPMTGVDYRCYRAGRSFLSPPHFRATRGRGQPHPAGFVLR
jgi:hypothetical protein